MRTSLHRPQPDRQDSVTFLAQRCGSCPAGAASTGRLGCDAEMGAARAQQAASLCGPAFIQAGMTSFTVRGKRVGSCRGARQVQQLLHYLRLSGARAQAANWAYSHALCAILLAAFSACCVLVCFAGQAGPGVMTWCGLEYACEHPAGQTDSPKSPAGTNAQPDSLTHSKSVQVVDRLLAPAGWLMSAAC